jgi:hypothetical protein
MAKMSRFGLVQTVLTSTAPNLIKVVGKKLDTIQPQKYPDMPIGQFKAVYRNLHARKHNLGLDLWSILNAHETDGKCVVELGVTHGVEFGLRQVITNNVTTITKGCAWINRRGKRKAVGFVGGIITDTKPLGILLGRLTLDLAKGSFQIVTDSGQIPFDANTAELWFCAGNTGCQVYTK